MRSIRRILWVSLFALTSCASLDSRAKSTLVGDWVYQDNVQACHYSFHQDGTFTGEVRFKARVVSKFAGHWAIRGDRLLYLYTKDVLGRIPAGSTDSDRLLRVEKNAFVIEAADGSRRRYQRGRWQSVQAKSLSSAEKAKIKLPNKAG